MSITRRYSEFEDNPFGCSAAGQCCFFCGQFLQDPAVQWHGATGHNIYLHGPCVIEWLPRLMRDALDLRYAGQPCHRSMGAVENGERA